MQACNEQSGSAGFHIRIDTYISIVGLFKSDQSTKACNNCFVCVHNAVF